MQISLRSTTQKRFSEAKIMWIPFWCLIPSKFTSAIPRMSCAARFAQSPVSQQAAPLCFCPFAPQLHRPSSHIPLLPLRHLSLKPPCERYGTAMWKEKLKHLCSPTAPLSFHRQSSFPQGHLKRHLCRSLNRLLWQSLTASVSQPWHGRNWASPAQDELFSKNWLGSYLQFEDRKTW